MIAVDTFMNRKQIPKEVYNNHNIDEFFYKTFIVKKHNTRNYIEEEYIEMLDEDDNIQPLLISIGV